MLLLLAVTAADRQVAGAALAVVGARLLLSAEAGEVLIHGDTSVIPRQLEGRSSGHKLLVYRKFTDFNGHETPPPRQKRERLIRDSGVLVPGV